ncbi:hypothetical protein CEXT_492321 [Caerostris extrusa]|uniref:Uncharacterized protein n=1 Tax=Caerostris extrusa TaxID=172846 RepID=A0AAV4WVX9_CAEEX|nr:hypothetical protein CEXT_492321 [Caerostris extrusa]
MASLLAGSARPVLGRDFSPPAPTSLFLSRSYLFNIFYIFPPFILYLVTISSPESPGKARRELKHPPLPHLVEEKDLMAYVCSGVAFSRQKAFLETFDIRQVELLDF